MNNSLQEQLISMLYKFGRTVIKNQKIATGSLLSILLVINLLIRSKPALAHHPMGGKIPSNFVEGFLSGLGHPVIGIDHLVFVIAIGLLAVTFKKKLGIVIPLVFTIATTMGTGIHLLSVNLPIPEIIISASIAIVGIFLAKKNQSNLGLLAALGAIAGIFHGYAYGEAIVGAETTALNAYLLGFSLIQLTISAIAFYCGQLMTKKAAKEPSLILRFAGFTIFGIGLAFLSNAIVG